MTKDDLPAERLTPRGNLWPNEAWVAEIQGATRELLFRLADIPIEPGQRRALSPEEVWRLDEVRAAMVDALQNG